MDKSQNEKYNDIIRELTRLRGEVIGQTAPVAGAVVLALFALLIISIVLALL